MLPQVPEQDNSGVIAPQWLTYKQAVSYTGLSRCTIWRYLERGELEAARIGRAIRISRESLDQFMRSRCG